MAVSAREQRDPPKRPGLRRWWRTLGARLDGLLNDGDRWKAKGLRSFVPAAIFGWFGVAWVDLRILAVAGALAIGGFWHARRRLGREELTDDDGDLL